MVIEHTQRMAASAAQIFSHYADVPNWPQWDHELKAAAINGPFASGSTGMVHPKQGPKSDVVFADVEPNQGFAVECKLPLCLMRFEHALQPTGGGTVVTHRVVFKGALAWFFGRVIGGGMGKSLPKTMADLEAHVLHRKVQHGLPNGLALA